jgi:ATP-binding cassette subfamily B protein
VPPQWQEYRSEHFVFRFMSDTQVENSVTALATRLEAVRDAAVEALGLKDVSQEQTQVYLLSYVPDERRPDERGGESQLYEMPSRQTIAVYLSGAPDRVVERAFVELLLTSTLGIGADRLEMLIDGMLGYVARQIDATDPAGLNKALVGLQSEGRRLALANVLRGPAAEEKALYQQVVTSFVTFLLTSYGVEAFKRFARRFDPDAPDPASEAAYGKSMASLEQEWLATLQQAQPVASGTSQPPATGSAQPAAVPGASYGEQLTASEAEQLAALQQTQPPAPDSSQPPAPPGVVWFLRRSLGYLRPYWAQEVFILLSAAIGSLFIVVLSLAFGGVIEALGNADYDYVRLIVLGVAALFIVHVPATLGENYLVARVGAGVMNDIQAKMFDHLQRLSTDFYFRTRPGEITSRFTNDLALLNAAMTQVIPMLAGLVITFVGSLISLFFLNGLLALAVMIALPLFFILPAWFGRKAARATHEMQEDRAMLNSTVQENIGAQQVIKAYSLQRLSSRRFRDQLEQSGRTVTRGSFLGSLPGVTANLSVLLIQVLALVGGALAVYYGALGLGALVSFQLLVGGVTGPIMSITGIWQMLLQASVGMQRVEKLLEEQPQIVDPPDARDLGRFRKEIRFENVSFSYTGEQMNLRDVNLAIRAGQSVAFVGPSGSGKSTILNLIMRFYDPTSGAVAVDGQDLRRVTQESLRSQIGAVFQETFLYNATVRENITLGKTDAASDQIEAAAKAAEIHDFIMTLPQGYDSPVGERGGQLSGGQRQRIAIARALLYDPEILVLDEPTSALDPQTEVAINDTLHEQGRERTVATVTHRLASVVDFDRIFVLERGSIVEQGSHDELLRARGLYYRLWGQQNGFEDAARVGVEASRLRAIPFFENLNEAMLPTLAGRFFKEQRAEGQRIFEEGDPGDKLYFIDRGEVEVVITEPGGKERRVALLRDGDYFGEIALLEEVPRTATVRTRAPTSLLTLHREQFFDLLGSAPGLRTAFERGVEARRQANLVALQEAVRADEQ